MAKSSVIVKLIHNIVTESDNHTYDIIRIMAVCAVVEFMGLSAFEVLVRHASFDMVNFGIGLGSVFIAVGTALKIKPETKADNGTA